MFWEITTALLIFDFADFGGMLQASVRDSPAQTDLMSQAGKHSTSTKPDCHAATSSANGLPRQLTAPSSLASCAASGQGAHTDKCMGDDVMLQVEDLGLIPT